MPTHWRQTKESAKFCCKKMHPWRRLPPLIPPLHFPLSSKTPPIKTIQPNSSLRQDPKDFPSSQSISFETLPMPTSLQQRKQIIKMNPTEYKNAAIGVAKPSLIERRGEANLTFRHLAPDGKRRTTELLFWVQQDIDWRPEALKRVWDSISLEDELKRQRFNPKRNAILGSDLSAAHFLLARGGSIKFQNQPSWVNSYRLDVVTSGKAKEDLEDLSPMTIDKCTIPVSYDPTWRVQCIDASRVPIHYEGFANFEHLNHVTWMSLKQSPFVNDWCLDRVMNYFGHTLEYLDLSGCPGISERGLAAMWRFTNLKTLVLFDLQHVKNIEIVSAHLEDLNPNLTCVGINYENKIKELQEFNEELENEHFRKLEQIEKNTIDVEVK